VAELAVSQGSARIRSLDILRGVGVLGMIAVHMQLFAYPSVARWNPTVYGDFTGLNWWAWLVTSLLADGKFITIFAMLLGVSIVMTAGGTADSRIPAWRIHMRRMSVLLILGFLHAYLLWFGDMLVPLALSGAVAFFARRLSPRRLLVLGGLVFAAASVLSVTLTWFTARSDPAALAAWRAQWTPRSVIINLEIAQYRGGWIEQMAQRVPAALETELVEFVTKLLWQMTGLMLLGMALFKLGVLTASRSRAFYLRMGALGFGAGTLLTVLALWRSYATKWDLLDFVLVSQQLHYWGDLFVAVGWVALVMLLCQRGLPLRSVEAVGRMALTNYLMQSVICTTIFYGHGLGLFGRVDRARQLAMVVAIWALQLAASRVWLRYFAVGPVEWLTRWLVFRRRPSFLRSSPVVVGA
jgi:uncharacterized protein